MPRLRLSYTKFADLAAGQVGEPGEGYLVSPATGFFVHVRRDDPSELLAFQIEHFSESFADETRHVLASLLGGPIMERLAELWASVPSQTTLLPAPSTEDLERVMKAGNVELVTSIPQTDKTTRAERIHFLDTVDAWASDNEEPRYAASAAARGALTGLGHLGNALGDAVGALLGATEAVVVGARLTPVVVRGESGPAQPTASELVLTPEALDALGGDAQARATLSHGTLQIWMVGLTNLTPGQTVRVVAVTRSGDAVADNCVVEDSPPRLAGRLVWPDPEPPAEIAIAILGR